MVQLCKVYDQRRWTWQNYWNMFPTILCCVMSLMLHSYHCIQCYWCNCVKLAPFSFVMVSYFSSVSHFWVWLYPGVEKLYYSFPVDVTLRNVWVHATNHACHWSATHIWERCSRGLTESKINFTMRLKIQ